MGQLCTISKITCKQYEIRSLRDGSKFMGNLLKMCIEKETHLQKINIPNLDKLTKFETEKDTPWENRLLRVIWKKKLLFLTFGSEDISKSAWRGKISQFYFLS